MQDVPDRLTLKRNRDLEGISTVPWPRRAIIALIVLCSILGLLNVFGQRPDTAVASSAEADLKLYAPSHLRGGLLFTARFHVHANTDVKNAILILDTGWVEAMSINTIEPSPLGEASRNGDLLFTLGHIPAGQKFRLFMEFQVGATNVGRRHADVTLYDGGTKLVHIDREVTVYP